MTKAAKYARKDALEYVVDLFEEQTNPALANRDHFVYEGHFTNDDMRIEETLSVIRVLDKLRIE